MGGRRAKTAATGRYDAASAQVRPLRPDGGRYASYTDAVAALDRPALFENRPCYRLLDARLAAPAGLRIGETSYFEGIDLGHAVAHELAAAWQRRGDAVRMTDLPLRALAGDPCALARRPALVAVTTLTLRRDAGGGASFVLHWRDPAKVNHGGGLYQVMPVGLFQPVTDAAAAIRHDLSLWKSMAREFSEEFLGTPEDYQTSGGLLDYEGWPFYRRLTAARREGRLAVHCLGLGVDPLTFATDVLAVAVFDAPLFDAEFARLVALNAEGRVITGGGPAGIPFTAETVARLTGGREPLQAVRGRGAQPRLGASRPAARLTPGISPELPVVLASAVNTASQAAIRRWFAADPPVPLRPLVREALGQVATAFTDAARAVQPG